MGDKFVYKGLFGKRHPIFVAADETMSAYGLIAGGIYEAYRNNGTMCVLRKTGDSVGQSISEQLLNIYFKPLSEVRNEKLTELGI